MYGDGLGLGLGLGFWGTKGKRSDRGGIKWGWRSWTAAELVGAS